MKQIMLFSIGIIRIKKLLASSTGCDADNHKISYQFNGNKFDQMQYETIKNSYSSTNGLSVCMKNHCVESFVI